jgi:hypothetical protein
MMPVSTSGRRNNSNNGAPARARARSGVARAGRGRNRRDNNNDETMQQLLASGTADSTYKNEWKYFKEWIDDQVGEPEPEVLNDFPDVGAQVNHDDDDDDGDGTSCYITRANLDAYFQHVVVHRTGGTDTIKRIEYALKHYALYHEHRLTDANVRGVHFTSEIMKAAIAAQSVKEKRRGEIGSQIDHLCPHRFCKHTMSIKERVKVVTAAINGGEWRNAIVAINLGHNIALRGASTRALTLCDLLLATGYGPGSDKSHGDPRFDRTLNIVLRKGPVHKDRFSSVKQVGFWRHRNYLLDPNFSIGLAVLYSLRKEGASVEFKQRAAGGTLATSRPLWWDLPLIEWNDRKGTFTFCLIVTLPK